MSVTRSDEGDRHVPPAGFVARDERRHDAVTEEWWFACWSADGAIGLVSGWRLVGADGWYWAGLVRRGQPLVHMAEWSVPQRSNPLLAKAPEMWAEIECIAPFEQWTIGNEMYAVALDDPDDALGRALGTLTPFAMDLEWYATERSHAIDPAGDDPAGDDPAGIGPAGDETGYRQRGVVHGTIELVEGRLDLAELPAERWHRWGTRLGEAPVGPAVAHLGSRVPVRFPDGTVMDLVLAADGWRRRGHGMPGSRVVSW